MVIVFKICKYNILNHMVNIMQVIERITTKGFATGSAALIAFVAALASFFAFPQDASRTAAAVLPVSPKPAAADVDMRRLEAKPAVPVLPEAPVLAEAEDVEKGRVIGSGEASYYGRGFAGRPTASGETFDPAEMTAAHRSLPFGARVRVTNRENGRSVVVRINDRGPYAKGRLIDVSQGAARKLGMIDSGTADVRLEVLA